MGRRVDGSVTQDASARACSLGCVLRQCWANGTILTDGD